MNTVANAYRGDEINRALNSHAIGNKSALTSQIPKVCFAAEWKKAKRKLEMKLFNGLVLLQANNIRSTEDAVELRKVTAQHPYTYMPFVGLSAYSVMIVCKISEEETFEQYDSDQLAKILQNAYKHLHYIYSAQLGLTIDNLPPALDLSCHVSYDPDIYYNPNSEPFYVREVEEMVPQYKAQNNSYGTTKPFGIQYISTLGTIFECCLADAEEKAHMICDTSEYFNDATLSLLADYCCESGLPQIELQNVQLYVKTCVKSEKRRTF